MDSNFEDSADGAKTDRGVSAKKPYQKPSFKFERVFETMALSCGKIDPTEGQCAFGGTKSS